MKTIAIIGGGFSGTLVAVNLARLSEEPLRVVLINAKRPLGRGTAYGTTRCEHLLNVVARNMSAFPDIPGHFVQWLQTRSEFGGLPESELREMFAPRHVYGDYLRGLLEACLHPIDPRPPVSVEALEEEAVDVAVDSSGAFSICLGGGDSIAADRIVLATGNQPPGAFPSTSPLKHDPRYRSDPWDDWLSRLPPPGKRILLLGTGLTMVDIVLTLTEIGWDGQVLAVSRHGMLPKSHFRGIAYEDYLPEDAAQLGLQALRRIVTEHCELLRQMSQNPAIAIDKLRPHTQRLWQSLSADEKRQFLTDDVAQWNVTRHRIASAIHNKITDALDSGKLRVISGTIRELQPTEQSIEVILDHQDGSSTTQAAELVVNCTGPQAKFSKSEQPLFANLIAKGIVQSDELDMGIAVNESFAAVSASGDSRVFAMGPLLRGTLWETTAVPELRSQAMRIAETLLEREPTSVTHEELIEYYI